MNTDATGKPRSIYSRHPHIGRKGRVMAFLGFLLLITGVVMNVQFLRRSRSSKVDPAELMRTPPFLVSTGLVLVGIVLLAAGGR